MYKRIDTMEDPIEVKGLEGKFQAIATFQMSFQPASSKSLAYHHLHVIDGRPGTAATDRFLAREEGVDAESGKMTYAVDSNCPEEIRGEVDGLLAGALVDGPKPKDEGTAMPGTEETDKDPSNQNVGDSDGGDGSGAPGPKPNDDF